MMGIAELSSGAHSHDPLAQPILRSGPVQVELTDCDNPHP